MADVAGSMAAGDSVPAPPPPPVFGVNGNVNIADTGERVVAQEEVPVRTAEQFVPPLPPAAGGPSTAARASAAAAFAGLLDTGVCGCSLCWVAGEFLPG